MVRPAARVESRLWAPLVGLAIAVSCGGDDAAGGNVPRCTPGSTQACLCVGGDTGVQSCTPSGAFGDCVCGGTVDGGAGATGGTSSGGAAGTAGTAGSAGVGGGAGAGGGSGHGTPVFSKEEAARICLGMAACMPQEFDGNFFRGVNSCIGSPGVFSYRSPGDFTAPYVYSRTTLRMKALYECMLGALPDCAALIACASPDGPVTAAACDPIYDSITNGDSCDGSKLTGCMLDGWSYTVDCARFDQECTVGGNPGTAYCDFPGCAPAMCYGANEETCGVSGARYLGVDCVLRGLECGTFSWDGGTSHGCLGGESCDPDAFQDVCEGNVKVECDRLPDDVSGQIERRDCASRPFEKRCEVDDCVATGTECDPDLPSTCAGSSVQLCDDGFVVSYDCSTIGFTSCSNGLCVP